MTDPTGAVYQYGYDALGNLQTVAYPDNAVRTYFYNESAYTAGADEPGRLTGIQDELGNRFATFSYDSTGLAVSTEHFGATYKYQILGVSSSSSSIATTARDPFGVDRTFNYQVILGVPRFTGVSLQCNHCDSQSYAAVTYDSAGNVASRTDFNGSKTCYAYGPRNLETARVEGAMSTEDCATVLTTLPARDDVRKITTVWHANWRLPVAIYEPRRKTTFIYAGDASAPAACVPSNANVVGLSLAVVCSKTLEDTSDSTGQAGASASGTGHARTWTYTYNQYGQLLTANDGNGTTTYAYYPATDPDFGKRGNLHTVTDAVGNVTTWTSYDAAGRPTGVQDANGTITTMTYKPRGWIGSRSIGGETTQYDYDDSGQLTKVTSPDGSYVSYTYDPARRLARVEDGLGNKVVYTLDELGNRRKEEYYDPTGALLRIVSRVYDSLNQLHQTIGYR